ncbi:hypothetical protein FD465_14210 [Escherichia coli]|nr:hypothetical protein [Escherichia coli]EFC4575032.1 hypothetical protein [Escherichia coli]EFE7870624.1 hypothetical protein [Escherichia coli]EFO0155689.1 hypothetical protein [Escherichia coli]
MQTLALHPGVLNVRYNRHTQITPNDMSHHQKIRINAPDSSRLSHRIARMVSPCIRYPSNGDLHIPVTWFVA